MEAQMQRPAPIEHEDVGLQSGESNQSGEKKSVIKKVKDKAKKLKHTIKKQSHGQGQEQEYRYDENADEEDDDDDEMENDREIHGTSPMQADTEGGQIDPMMKGEAKGRPTIPAQTGYGQEEPSENKHFPSPMGLEEDSQAPKKGFEDAPAPPSNYESKVPDPTGDGGKEAGVGNLVHRFDNLNVGDESETKADTGSHDQFNPESNQLPQSFDSLATEGMPRDTATGKASSVTSALTDKAISAKNVVASKLGYGGGSGQEGMSPSKKPESESTPGYTQRITETLNPVYDKVAGAGTAVMSKFQRGGESGNQDGQEGTSPAKKTESESAPAPGYTQRITETLNPVYDKVAGAGTAVMSKFQRGGESGNQGGQEGTSPAKKTEPESAPAPGYTQKITETLNPVYDKVAGAGTAVMSKFQRGGESGNQGGQEGMSPTSKTESESAPGYTQKITEKLNPVYEKVAGAGTAVMSKFQGGGEAGNQGGNAAATGTDKGLASKDYWSDKLKPGDEDKALSEAITDALHKKKEGYFQKTGEGKPTGNVTEPQDVATHQGTGVEGLQEKDGTIDSGRQSSGPGVVGRVKDAVGSWIGKGSGTQTAQDSAAKDSYVDHAGEQGRSQN